MQRPPYLKAGDTICLTSTARKISPEECAPAIEILESWGLKVQLSANLYRTDRQFAGTAAERTSGLQEALDDPNIKAILCARGGYGTIHLLEQLDFSKFIQKPKWIVGYSDVTALHTHLQACLNFESIHGTMAINMNQSQEKAFAVNSLKKALFGEELTYSFQPLEGSSPLLSPISGPLLGGNLSILYSLTGTKRQVDTSGAILFIEDLDEYLYHIDRMMMNLLHAGMIKDCKAILIGGMSDMNDNTIPYGESALEIIMRIAKENNVPVFAGFPAGHIANNGAIYLGREAILEAGDKGIQLRFNG